VRRVLLAAAAAAAGAAAVVVVAPRAGSPAIGAAPPPAASTPDPPAAPSDASGLAAGPASAPPVSTRNTPSPRSPAPTSHRRAHAAASVSRSAPTSPKAHRSSRPRPTRSAPPPAPPPPVTRTVTGPVVSNGWGPIQVRVTVRGKRVTAVSVPVTPSDGRSAYINARAVPILVQEALRAQSAQVAVVSGATDTSRAFMSSLAAALQQAR